MADSKNYLNVPYQDKDLAKALGARWDAVNKKWYIPANKDITIFKKWYIGAITSELSSSIRQQKPQNLSSKNSPSTSNETVGVITYSADKNFVAYNGDEPPWN